jgi:putative transposase
MTNRWTCSTTTVYNIGYHFIWCVKYRRKVLSGKIELKLKKLLREKAASIGVTIAELEVMPEHVHVFVKARPVDSPHWIAQQLKGYSSRELRKEFETLRSRLPTLWTRSYYCESCGHLSEEAVRKYIEDQKGQ